MPYCDLSYAMSALRQRDQVTALSEHPSLAEAQELLDGIEARIDAALASTGFSVPVSSPTSLRKWLREIAANGLRAEIMRVKYGEASGPNSESATARWQALFDEDMARLWAGELGTFTSDDGPSSTSYWLENPVEDSDLGGANAEPVFGQAITV